RAARKELTRLERAIDKLAEREQQLHVALAEAATTPDALVELGRELDRLLAEKDDAETRWMELAAEHDG
ncbi:MAG: ABC transporter ATP-binding protein, partial [Mycobacteriaceae bacterium]|nr:ABC transporter ATP-binding protein [Mycobacteriaceae bacterium]